MKRIRRAPTIDGMSVDDFLRANADPIFLHQEGLWEYIETDGDPDSGQARGFAMTSSAREPVSFRTYRIDVSAADPAEVADARKILRRMHRAGGLSLDLR